MQIAATILGCLLLTVSAEEGGSEASAPSGNKPSQHRLKPAEMVAEAMVLPAGSTVTGQPLSLLTALSSTSDRRQQLEVTRTYWHLVHAVAVYRFCFDHAQEMGRTKSAGSRPAALRLAQATAAAVLSQAELEATRAQCELARLVRLPAGAPLPLPTDRPHVGPYRTNFRELFAGRSAPEPAALVERILPIRRKVIDDQAVAVEAAEDVLAAAVDDCQGGRTDASAWIAASEELLRQRRALVQSACDYNRNIADYALVVAGPATGPQALTAMLIGPQQQAAPLASGWTDPQAVQPAAATEPVPNVLRSGGEPTLAPPRDVWRGAEPTPAPPGQRPQKNEPTLAPPRTRPRPVEKDEPTLAPPRDPSDASEGRPATTGFAPLEPPSTTTVRRTVNKPLGEGKATSPLPTNLGSVPGEGQGEGKARSPRPPGEDQGEGAALLAAPLYSALVDSAPAGRTRQLTAALHWDRSLPEGSGRPLGLADCIPRQPGADRLATIGAYWLVRQRSAEYQVLLQQSEMLDGLALVVLEHRHQPTGATEMLRLRAAQAAAQAATRRSHVALVEAQYALALHVGAAAETVWPLASTTPHSGRYLLKLNSQPPGLAESWPVRRPATAIPGLGENVQLQAAAVVEADAARAALAEKYRAGQAPLDQVLDSVARQTEHTLAFLNTLTEYNRAIAEYVLAVLPPATPVDQLVAALVVRP